VIAARRDDAVASAFRWMPEVREPLACAWRPRGRLALVGRLAVALRSCAGAGRAEFLSFLRLVTQRLIRPLVSNGGSTRSHEAPPHQTAPTTGENFNQLVHRYQDAAFAYAYAILRIGAPPRTPPRRRF
jgi:hypothetical protein